MQSKFIEIAQPLFLIVAAEDFRYQLFAVDCRCYDGVSESMQGIGSLKKRTTGWLYIRFP